ncbi:hypothetical protein D3C76_1010100 [compost metagenome]
MTEDDLQALGLAFLVLEPGFVAWWCGTEAFLALEVEFAFGGAKTHAGEIIGDHPQARHAFEVIVPFRRIVAVHAIEVGRQQVVVTQGGLDFGSTLQGFAQRPLGWNAGMDQCHVALFVVVHELLLAQPFEQLGAIRRFNDLAQGIGLLQAFDVASGRQQVQVVVAEHAHQRFADAIEEAQGFQRLWAAVDQVAHQPQAIALRVERHLFEQALQGLKAALQVADSVGCHQCRAPGTARRKGAMMASKCLPSSDSI